MTILDTDAPERIYSTPDATIWSGDARAVMAAMPTASIDALITDPPYGLSSPPDINTVLAHWEAGDDYHHAGRGFMSAAWDSFVPGPAVWAEALRVCKPGAPALVFAGSRTLDLMMTSMRIAGWEIAGTRHWIYGSGFPKSLDIGRAMQSAAVEPSDPARSSWNGWKSALKGAHEPIVVAFAPGPRRAAPAGHPYTAKAPTDERVIAYVPTCDCHGDPHLMGASADIAAFIPQTCTRCGDTYTEYRHPTVKSLACIAELVLACRQGGVVLDPFAGTGTTGVAALQEGRSVVLVDADPVHAAMSRSRLDDIQPALFSLDAA
jgi:DNA modification methylase